MRQHLKSAADALARQRHLCALRDGVVGALPLVLVGSLFLLAAQPPSRFLQHLVDPYAPILLIPYRMLSGAIALYITFSAAHSLAKSYGLDPASAGLIALAAYLVAAIPPSIPSSAPLALLPLQRLGSGGIFAGLLIALASVELGRFFARRQWTVRLPSTAPATVIRSFLALTPALAVVLSTFLVTQVLRIDLVHWLEAAARPLLGLTDSFGAIAAVIGIDSGLWLLGVHAAAATAPLRPLWEAMLVGNMEAAAQGARILPHIASQHFFLWFVWQGGSGATLPLAIHLLRARSAQLRAVARVGIVPALCNINEPILFGAPVVLNPQLAIPFIAAPILSAGIAYLSFRWNWVTRPYLEMPWTLPAPVGAFLSTGGDYRAVILQMVNLAVGFLFYWPFVRRYDRFLQKQNPGSEQAQGGQGLVSELATPGSAGTLPRPDQTP